MVQVFRSLRRMTKGLAGFDQQFVDSGNGQEAILVDGNLWCVLNLAGSVTFHSALTFALSSFVRIWFS